jgi:hypothetical protein
MPQDDKFKREIDRVGLALAKLISKLLHIKYHHDDTLPGFIQEFQSELDIDLDTFLQLKNGEEIKYLVNSRSYSVDNLRNLGNILYEMAHKTNDAEQKKSLLEKTRTIYEYVSAHSGGTLFLDVDSRLKELGNSI